MLKKWYVKSHKTCKVAFELPKAELPEGVEANTVYLAGEFDNWDARASPMPLNSRNVYRVQLELEPGREYQFRYLVNGDRWCNDWHADAYVANPFGTDNCVVSTPAKA